MTQGDMLGVVGFLAYYLCFAGGIALLSRVRTSSKELVRKSYHVMCSLSIFILLLVFDHWYVAVMAVAGAFTLGYLAIIFTRKVSSLDSLRIERELGGSEVGHQAVYVQAAFIILITLFWGISGPRFKYSAAVGIMAWGFGDAAAAVFGRRFGRHKVNGRAFDPGKSVEGACAMAVASFVAVFVTLSFMAPTPLVGNLIISAILGSVASVLELLSRKGLDNIVIPLGVSFLSAPLVLCYMLVTRHIP